MKNAHKSDETLVALYAQRAAAMEKHFAGRRSQIPAGGRMVKLTDVAWAFKMYLWKRETAIAAHAAYKTALAERDEHEAVVRVIDDAMKGWVLHGFGRDSQEAEDFGYAPRKKSGAEAARVEVVTEVKAPVAGEDA